MEKKAKESEVLGGAVDRLEREVEAIRKEKEQVEGRVIDMMGDLEKVGRREKAQVESEKRMEEQIKMLKAEVDKENGDGKRKFGEGVAKGLEEGERGVRLLKEKLKEKDVGWANEKAELMKGLEGWKERGRVWGEQAEALDREIMELKGEREKMIGDNKELVEGLGRAREAVKEEEEKREELEKDVERAKIEGERATTEVRVEMEVRMEERLKEAVELGVKETSRRVEMEREGRVRMEERLKVELERWEGERRAMGGRLAEGERKRDTAERALAKVTELLGGLGGAGIFDLWEDGARAEVWAGEEAKKLREEYDGLVRKIHERVEKGREIGSMIQDCESKISRHGKDGGSLSPGGTMSLSHVKIKRRLNEELEGFLLEIDKNRKLVKQMNLEVVKLLERRIRVEAEGRRKERERGEGLVGKVRKVREVVGEIVEAVEAVEGGL